MVDESEPVTTQASSGKTAAKNRIAQQRYRQRQKEKREEVQKQIEVLNRRLQNVELQHRSLNERNRLLERLANIADSKSHSSSTAQASERAPPLTNELAEKRAAAMAKFINTLRRNKPPLVSSQGLTQAVCEDMEPLKFEYVHNLSMLMGEHQREELDEYIMSGRRAREEMMEVFDLRDIPTEEGFRRHNKAVPIPFKMSMVHAMELSEAQKESFLEAKRSMTREYEAIIMTRKQCTAELKRNGETSPSQYNHKNHKHFVTELFDGLSANEAFMESLKAEQRCLFRYYTICAQLVTPLQEARCLVEGYADGMWMDFWVLPMIIEAERGGNLPSWLTEHCPKGTARLTLKTLMGVDPYAPALHTNGSGVSSEVSTAGAPLLTGAGGSVNAPGGVLGVAAEEDGELLDDLFSGLPQDFGMGFDCFDGDLYGQLFPSVPAGAAAG